MLSRTQLPTLLVLPLLAAVLGAAGCGGDEDDGAGGGGPEAQVTAVATTTQLGDFVRQVGGDRVQVEQILQPNVDPHEYEPRPSDARALGEAEVVFQSGGDLDEFLSELIDSAGTDAPVVKAIDSVETIEGEAHGHEEEGEEHAAEEGEHAEEEGEHAEEEDKHAEEEGEHAEEEDPHWWQNPRNSIRVVAAIRDALIEADPDGRETYERNAAAYIDRLERLDRSIASCIERIPPEQRKLVTTHDAFGYYADRYGLEVIGALIPSLSSQAQASSGDVNALVKQIEEQDVKAIFPESAIDPELEEAVSRESGAVVGKALYADSLGPEGSDGETYVEAIASDTAKIVEGLSGGEESCRPRA